VPLADDRHIVVLAGAGIWHGAGLPTYRGGLPRSSRRWFA
jgi:NAD-dependent SIR2 family protein deacetylase